MNKIESHSWQPTDNIVLSVWQYGTSVEVAMFQVDSSDRVFIRLSPDAFNDAFLVFEDLAKIIQKHQAK